MGHMDSILDLALSELSVSQISQAFGKEKAGEVELFRKSGRYNEYRRSVLEQAYVFHTEAAWAEIQRRKGKP